MDILGTGVNGQVIRAERQTVPFFEGLEVDGYRMPDGDFRVGVTGASRVLGYPDNWLFRVLRGENRKQLESLQGLGFTQKTSRIVSETSRGDREAQTIGLRDFNRLISYAVFDGKRPALALQLALTEVALNDFFRDAFGDPPLSIDEKRNLFYQTYAATISPEMWRQMDREEILQLALAGDSLYFPQHNDWEEIEPWTVEKSSRIRELGHSGLHLNYEG